MFKMLALGRTSLIGMGLATIFGATPEPQDGPPPRPPEAKKGGPGGPEGDLRRAYDLLRHLRAEDGPSGKPEERLKDLTERATKLYRKAIEAKDVGEIHASHEYGTAAHDLARAVDHARNASRFGRPDPALPPPPPGPDGPKEKSRRDLRHAYDRIREVREQDFGPESKFYLDTARDLYTAARHDAEADRDEPAGGLARAAEAITHVPEHLAKALKDGPDRPKAKKDRPEPPKEKAKKDHEKEKRDRPEFDNAIPPPID